MLSFRRVMLLSVISGYGCGWAVEPLPLPLWARLTFLALLMLGQGRVLSLLRIAP